MDTIDFDLLLNRIKDLTRSHQDNEVSLALGISPQAVADAKRKRKIPRTWLRTIEEKYGVSREELCKPPERVRAQVVHPYGHQEIEEENEIPNSEMMYMTSVVLESSTVYRSALASNIRAFYQAVKGEGEMNDMRNEVVLMRKDIARLEELIRNISKTDEFEKKRAGNDH